jgi:hypothetical protein
MHCGLKRENHITQPPENAPMLGDVSGFFIKQFLLVPTGASKTILKFFLNIRGVICISNLTLR